MLSLRGLRLSRSRAIVAQVRHVYSLQTSVISRRSTYNLANDTTGSKEKYSGGGSFSSTATWCSAAVAAAATVAFLSLDSADCLQKDLGAVKSLADNSKPRGTNDTNDDEKEVHKSKAGFKERKIIEYENRLRAYSTPDKVFRYFATLQDAGSQVIYMTPEDFVRSLTPDTLQPPGLGLDEFKRFEKKKYGKYESSIYGQDSVFHCFDGNGLISFSDYIFLLTVLGTSARHIGIAFKMFDLNGDGEVTADEFEKVRSLFLSMSSTGMRHRDHKTTGNVLSNHVNTGIMAHFFGPDSTGKLTVEQFVTFKRSLQHEVMQLEFNSYNPVDGKISEVEFCEILLTYASFSEKKKRKMVSRVKQGFKRSNDGITFKDYLGFFDFLLNIRDVDMALSFHTVSGHGIEPETFQRVAKTVAEVDLRPHLVNVVFKLFDDNDDGQLSNREFVAVMKDKLCRGLNRPKDTGLTRFLGAIFTCAKEHVTDLWQGEEA